MRQNFGKMKISKIKFLLIKMIDVSNKLSCIAYKCKDIVYKMFFGVMDMKIICMV